MKFTERGSSFVESVASRQESFVKRTKKAAAIVARMVAFGGFIAVGAESARADTISPPQESRETASELTMIHEVENTDLETTIFQQRRQKVVEHVERIFDTASEQEKEAYALREQRMQELHLTTVPEYARTLERGVLLGTSLKPGSFVTQHEDRLYEFVHIIDLLPEDTPLLFDSAASAEVYQQWLLERGFDQTAARIHPEEQHVLLENDYGAWAQDVGEFVMNGKESVLLTNTFNRATKVSTEETPSTYTLEQAHVVVDGGDTTVTNRHVLVGSSTVDRTRDTLSRMGQDSSDASVKRGLEETFDKPVLFLHPSEAWSPTLFHIDQYITPIADDMVLVADYHYNDAARERIVEEVEAYVADLRLDDTKKGRPPRAESIYETIRNDMVKSGISTARQNEWMVNDAKRILDAEGYEIVSIPISHERLVQGQSYLNGMLYKGTDGKTHFLMPSFEDTRETDAVRAVIESRGIVVTPIEDAFFIGGGNIHCATNVL